MTSFYYYSNIDRLIDFHLINWTYTLWKYYMPPWIINIRDVWLRARSFIDIRVWHKCQRKYANEGLHILSKVVWCHNNIFFSFDFCQNSSMVHCLFFALGQKAVFDGGTSCEHFVKLLFLQNQCYQPYFSYALKSSHHQF